MPSCWVSTTPPWSWFSVWRAIVLAWSPSMGCLLLNQVQFFSQYIYLYNGAILVFAGLHELVRLVLASYPVGPRRPWPLRDHFPSPLPTSREVRPK